MILKFGLLAAFVIFDLSLKSQAAILKESSGVASNSALELLKLPTEIRRSVIQGKSETYYSTFINIAFNESQGMSMRWRALIAAAELNGEKALEDLKKAGGHSVWFMRNAALVALSEVNPSEAKLLAKKLIKDKALVVRSAALEVLQKNQSEDVRELLWKELEQKYNFKGSQSLWIRHQIVEVLAESAQLNELKSFGRLLSDKDPRIHVAAVAGLEKMTGVKLGKSENKPSELVGLWKKYVEKENNIL
jgi:hypothetical protein